MTLEAFAASRALSLGVELELQLIDPHDGDLSPSSADLLRLVEHRAPVGEIKPEITAGMLEIATGVCVDHAQVLAELGSLREVLVRAADRLDIGLCGGGTHPFQHWSERRIVDTPRFRHLSSLYGYLAKQFTVFGQHVHVGCASADDALFLLHALSRFVPHFIALSAASPFVQGTDTSFHSARLNAVSAFPLSGRAPFVRTWDEFHAFFHKMTTTGVVGSMKDFYWDIRPKPEYGTVEVRVMDTPLTIAQAARLAAYVQSLASWILLERPFAPSEDDYLVYTFNRFQASRFGLEGTYVVPGSHEHRRLADEVVDSIARIAPHAAKLGAEAALDALRQQAASGRNDAGWLREVHAAERSLTGTVRRQCGVWRDG